MKTSIKNYEQFKNRTKNEQIKTMETQRTIKKKTQANN